MFGHARDRADVDVAAQRVDQRVITDDLRAAARLHGYRVPVHVDAGDGAELQLHGGPGEERRQLRYGHRLTRGELMQPRALDELCPGVNQRYPHLLGMHLTREPLRCGQAGVAGAQHHNLCPHGAVLRSAAPGGGRPICMTHPFDGKTLPVVTEASFGAAAAAAGADPAGTGCACRESRPRL